MKRLIFFLAFLSSCGTSEVCPRAPYVLATTTQVGDLVKEVVGDRYEVDVLIRGSLDPHSYELVKGDDERIDGAAALFSSGLGLEHGASLKVALGEAVALADEIGKKRPEALLSREGVVDPHIWMDLSLWAEGVDPIVDKLEAIDPGGGYFARGEALKEKMMQKHGELKEKIALIPEEKRFLVTSHDAFHYFTRAYFGDEGDRFAAPEGLSPDGQLGPSDIRSILSYVALHRVKVMFFESNVSPEALVKIASTAKSLSLEVRLSERPLYGDAMEPGYFEAMKQNGETLFDELDS